MSILKFKTGIFLLLTYNITYVFTFFIDGRSNSFPVIFLSIKGRHFGYDDRSNYYFFHRWFCLINFNINPI